MIKPTRSKPPLYERLGSYFLAAAVAAVIVYGPRFGIPLLLSLPISIGVGGVLWLAGMGIGRLIRRRGGPALADNVQSNDRQAS